MTIVSRFRKARAPRRMAKSQSLKEIQKFRLETTLRFDFKITGSPIHELHIAKTRAACSRLRSRTQLSTD
jgi:hypothetical protein